MPPPAMIYQLKITLRRIKPPIWRRVLVPSAISLAALHDVVQVAMGWRDSHLHAFEIGGVRYGQIVPGEFEEGLHDERRYALGDLVAPRQQVAYEYDYGDGWEHQIIVEKQVPSAPDVPGALCTAGARACPPEDCGGPYGYRDLIDALGDRRHARHAELREWIGGVFDPEAFDRGAINAALAKLDHATPGRATLGRAPRRWARRTLGCPR